jgi:hypothetical protein
MKRLNDFRFSFFDVRLAISVSRCMVPIGMALLFFAAPAMAQTRGGRTSDEELLKKLKEYSRNEIQREVFGEEQKKSDTTIEAGQGGDLNEQLKRELGAAAEKEDDNPLAVIARAMMQVRERMSQSDAGPATLTLQKQIVTDLDRLIEQARKSCGQCKSPGSQQSKRKAGMPGSKPSKTGAQKTGTKPEGVDADQKGDGRSDKSGNAEMDAMIKNLWGELPQHVREQMQQSPAEQFVPKYQQLIEDYFRDLSGKNRNSRPDEKMNDER